MPDRLPAVTLHLPMDLRTVARIIGLLGQLYPGLTTSSFTQKDVDGNEDLTITLPAIAPGTPDLEDPE